MSAEQPAHPPIEHHYTRNGYTGAFPVYGYERWDPAIQISKEGSRPVLRLSPEHAVKFGSGTKVNEAEALLLVEREAPGIPAPRVQACYTVGPYDRDPMFDGNYDTYIIMTFLEGKELKQVWADLNEAQKSSIADQLAGHMRLLRSIAPPSQTTFSSIDGGPLLDIVFDSAAARGPFNSAQALNDSLVAIQKKSAKWEYLSFLMDGSLAQIKHTQPVLTHADLMSRNIMVLDDQVTGIIDWEMCGWYPEYWEFAQCFRVSRWPEDWPPFVATMLEPHYLEWCLLRTISMHVW